MVPWDAEAESLDKRVGRGTSPRASTGVLTEACRLRVADEETSWLKSESKDTVWFVNTGLQGEMSHCQVFTFVTPLLFLIFNAMPD